MRSSRFTKINRDLTKDVVSRLDALRGRSAVIVEAPPGAGKSTLTVSVAKALLDADRKLQIPIVTQTNEQADDLVAALVKRQRLALARIVGGSGPSAQVANLAEKGSVRVGRQCDGAEVAGARVLVATARKWQYERARIAGRGSPFQIALIDEAYQMRSDMLLGIADLYDKLLCVGDPGQLDPFTVVDDSLWKGLAYSPARTALGTLRAFHEHLDPIQMPTSWRLPPSAAGIVSRAFYPNSKFKAGAAKGDRSLDLTRSRSRARRNGASVPVDEVLEQAAETGWAYVELPERFTVRNDRQIAETLADLTVRLLQRGATVVDELNRNGTSLTADRVALIAAHNDQVHAMRYALSEAGQDPDELVVSTANKIQGREYDVVLVWHPLAGRRDATAFHLEAGRMCVMLSRHRHACIVVGRAGAHRLLQEFPDSDPIFLDEPEKFPDGWQANHEVLEHLAGCIVG